MKVHFEIFLKIKSKHLADHAPSKENSYSRSAECNVKC